MKKTLRASTIIPPSLYVQRKADRQVRRVLDEMGRPGYVLVARQMGKTNLLLNARRELESPEDAFVYLDLSNPVESARDCFRAIVDTALETRTERLGTAASRIQGIRSQGLAPHKEHELELRELLRAIVGKLVIILDEIDSLTTSTFSDQVFAQIRSVYFSRANIAEYDRLTYLLSGVAEPSDLIKNPKLSPFNIGEKIYLDDFSEDEFSEFVVRTQLPLDERTRERVFYWASGNPRMSWDICSELEEAMLSGRPLSSDVVDGVVARIYLASFDRAPVDHIRTLVEATPEIRNALIEIKYGKGGATGDSAKTKLYLAGIIGSNRDAPRIKNRIIEASLSDAWLRDVERRKLSLLELAEQHVLRERYKEAVEVYQEFLAQGLRAAADENRAFNGLSQCYYVLGDYEQSLACLKKAKVDKAKHPAVYYSDLYREGLCLFRLKQYDQSIECFRAIIDWNGDQISYYRSLANLGGCLCAVDPVKHRDTICSFYSRLLAEVDAVDAIPADEKRTLKIAAHYNMSKAFRSSDDTESARKELDNALGLVTEFERPVVLYELAQLAREQEKKRELLSEAVDSIVDSRLVVVKNPKDSELGLTEVVLAGMFAFAFEVDRSNSFEKLLSYCTAGTGVTGERPINVLLTLLVSGKSAREPESLRMIGGRVADAAEAAGDEVAMFLCSRILAVNTRGQSAHVAYAEKYLELLAKQPASRALDPVDVSILAYRVLTAINEGRLEQAWATLEAIRPFELSTPPDIMVVLNYGAMAAAGAAGDRDNEVRYANAVLAGLTGESANPVLSKREVETVRKGAMAVVSGPPASVPFVRTARKIPRNEVVTVQYGDGHTVQAKYKKLEEDLRTGRCFIVTE